jgi:Bacterial regulatory proteins, tetR family
MKPAVRYKRASAETIRREILQGAVDIASAEGLEGVSMGRLAEEMRMSKSGIFAHFGSKEERGLEHEIAYARKCGEIPGSIQPAQLAFELHACVQEANWAFKLFDDKSAIRLARRAIAGWIEAASGAGSRWS